MYSGVDQGQWDPDALQLLRSEGRPAHQFNVIQGAVDTAAGILHQNPFRTIFKPQSLDKPGAVNLAQFLFEFEGDRGHWAREEMKIIRAGLVFKGVAKYSVDYSTSLLGNIGWEDIAPWNVTPDPTWASDNIKKLRFVYQDEFYDADYIRDHWGSKNPELAQAVKDMETSSGIQEAQYRLGTRWGHCYSGGKYRVIELHYMEDEEEAEVWDFQKGESLRSLPKPAVEILLEDDPTRYKKIVRVKRKSKVVVWCPAFGQSGILLASGNYALQMGRLPFDFFSAKNLYGQMQGMVDPLTDPQEVLNKRESSLTYWESQTTNASQVADVSFFPNERDRKKLEQSGNKPGEIHWADGGGRDLRSAIMSMPMGAAPVHTMQGAERMQTLIEHLAHMDTAVRPGAGTDPGQSGKHFAELLAASLVPFEPLNQALQAMWADRAESFIPAAQYIYAGVPRKIKAPKQTESIGINYPGMEGIENDIGTLDRYDYTIEASELGENKRTREINAITKQIQTTTNPLMRGLMELELVRYNDYDEDTKKKMLQAGQLYMDFQIKQVQSQVKQMDMAEQQAQQQIQAAQQQQAMGQPQQPTSPGGPDTASRGPGQGPIPEASGIAGQQSAANNARSPSDFH